jgi:hypothetical protein
VGEEAVELVIRGHGQQRRSFVNEAADLLYHLLILLAQEKSLLPMLKKSLSRGMKINFSYEGAHIRFSCLYGKTGSDDGRGPVLKFLNKR